MLLPDDFNRIVADTFYDKDVYILEKQTTSDDGWIEETGTVQSSFKANVQFSDLGTVQSELGLSERVDVSVTCATSVGLSLDDLFKHDSVTYKASAVVPYDSHLQIVGSKWQ